MSKITIDKSKVIIDGHASDLETCNTLTNLCDELSKSDKFKTVRYENGYGEFESISESEEKKFAPSRIFEIYSNDGSLRLAAATLIMTEIISVVEDGVISNNIGRLYTYSGDKIFKGLTLTKGSSNIDFPIGSDKSFYDLLDDICYIVEEELGYQVNINSNNGATTLAQNATVDSVVVTTTGAQLKCGGTVNATYTYSGSKLFAGLSTSANAVAAEYKPGDTISITAATTLYVVENIVLPDSYSTLTALFSDIATVIREKTGDTASIVADDFPDVIRERLQVIPQVTLISFTVSDLDSTDISTYEAEEGMSWNDFVNSAYNTDSRFGINSNNNVTDTVKYLSKVSGMSLVSGDDIIVSYDYYTCGKLIYIIV